MRNTREQSLNGERFRRNHKDGLRLLLQRWRSLASDPIWDDEDDGQDDCSWWYGERASVSQLAGAAWTLRGWAMQDYAWERRRPKGYAQIDLCVDHPKLELGFIAEAKQIWPRLTRPDLLATRVDRAFKQLQRELGRVKPDGWPQRMFVFVAPWTSTTKKASLPVSDSMLREFVSALGDLEGAAVWTFPWWARNRKIDYVRRTDFYPGVALLTREL